MSLHDTSCTQEARSSFWRCPKGRMFLPGTEVFSFALMQKKQKIKAGVRSLGTVAKACKRLRNASARVCLRQHSCFDGAVPAAIIKYLSGEEPDKCHGCLWPLGVSLADMLLKPTTSPKERANTAPDGDDPRLRRGRLVVWLSALTTIAHANGSWPSFLHTFGQCQKDVVGSWHQEHFVYWKQEKLRLAATRGLV